MFCRSSHVQAANHRHQDFVTRLRNSICFSPQTLRRHGAYEMRLRAVFKNPNPLCFRMISEDESGPENGIVQKARRHSGESRTV